MRDKTIFYEKKKVLAGNKLIAEFMGWKHIKAKGFRSPIYCNSNGIKKLEFELRYNSSWDALMPVMSKILEWCKVKYGDSDKMGDIFRGWHIGKIEPCWQAVVEFIGKYNSI